MSRVRDLPGSPAFVSARWRWAGAHKLQLRCWSLEHAGIFLAAALPELLAPLALERLRAKWHPEDDLDHEIYLGLAPIRLDARAAPHLDGASTGVLTFRLTAPTSACGALLMFETEADVWRARERIQAEWDRLLDEDEVSS